MTTVRIWFTKTGEASYISLLDLQRVMQRVLKRSGLPVWYSLGFNPHIYMTFACPLPLGQESLVESVDVKTEQEPVDFAAWQAALATAMPQGLNLVEVTLPQNKAEEIGFCRYTLSLPAEAAASLEAYNQLESAVIIKKTKRGQKPVELKEYLAAFDYQVEANRAVCLLELPAGEGLNLNPSLWLGFLQEHCGLDATQANVLRTGILLKNKQDFR